MKGLKVCPITKKECVEYGCEYYNRFIGCTLPEERFPKITKAIKEAHNV